MKDLRFPKNFILSKYDSKIYEYQDELISELSDVQSTVEEMYKRDKSNAALAGVLMYLTYAIASLMIPAGVLFNLIEYRRTNPYWIKYSLADKLDSIGSDVLSNAKLDEQLNVIYEIEKKILSIYFSSER